MAKAKTRSAAKKRFKITGSGKVIMRHQYGRHLRSNKSKSQKTRYNRPKAITGYMGRKIKKMLPYRKG